MKLQSVFAAVLCSTACAVSTQAEISAKVWLREHSGGNPDELAELKTENPDAYALVKALLTKRSLGLLDPKHPTASFAAPPPKEDTDQPSGAEVYAKFATTPKEQLALSGQQSSASPDVPYPDAQNSQSQVPYPEAHGSSQNWMSWKPDNNDDDAMVQNVLGAVADLTKKKSLRGQSDSQDENPLQAEAARMEDQGEPSFQPNTEAAPPQPVAEPVVQASVEAPAEIAKPAAPVQDEPRNALTAFTFDDSATTTTTTTLRANKGANPLASWLGIVKPHVQVAAPAPEEKLSNPYLMDLQ
jgi:hypothetical protein